MVWLRLSLSSLTAVKLGLRTVLLVQDHWCKAGIVLSRAGFFFFLNVAAYLLVNVRGGGGNKKKRKERKWGRGKRTRVEARKSGDLCHVRFNFL